MRKTKRSLWFIILLILLSGSIITLSGCTDNVKKINDTDITHNGHRYLILKDMAVPYSQTVVHDPDCPKCSRK